jgi:hypothetical protein
MTTQSNMPKTKKRQSRYFPSPNPKPIVLTERRIEELKILYHHRLADSDIFRAVLKGSNDKIQKELRRLFDNGYIGVPLEQLIMHKKHKGGQGRTENIYAIGNKGLKFLEQNFDYHRPKTDLDKKNREMGETTIFHDIALTRLWACLKAGLEQKRERTGEQYNLALWYQDRPDREHLTTELILRNGEAINIIPDAVFRFQCPVSQYLFFVEYYRTIKTSHQNYLNKLKYYNLYYQQKKFTKYRIKKGFRVITLVPTRARAENLIKLINEKKENEELQDFTFWFLAEEDYRLYRKEKVKEKSYKKIPDFESILEPIFRTPLDEEWHRLEE